MTLPPFLLQQTVLFNNACKLPHPHPTCISNRFWHGHRPLFSAEMAASINVMKNNEEHMGSNEVLFFEHYAAAQSLKSAWTRLASTYGCMMVVLSRRTLTIKPHWFAKWLISPLRLDLCHEIPISNIRDVTETGKWFSYGKVELHFETDDGKDQGILIYMKKYREFIDKATNAKYQ